MVLVCNYAGPTWFILIGMIVTGSARSIVVKLAYQSGLQAPLTVTLLYLLGQTFALSVFWIQTRVVSGYKVLSTATKENEIVEKGGLSVELVECPGVITDVTNSDAKSLESSSVTSVSVSSTIFAFYASLYTDEMPNGSSHGLSSDSNERLLWVHRIPWYMKPGIPALFNLLNSTLRWASLVYVDASVAEMMISGLELTLSVVAARVFRKRMVAKSRWIGVIIVATGVIIIERANNSKHLQQRSDSSDDIDSSSRGKSDATIGIILIILQATLSVLQDIGEEIFMQACDFPATMMLGMEGLYGFCVGFIIYVTFGNKLGVEDIDSTLSMIRNNPKQRWWIVGLPFLFLITGIFNIKATEATSAMTRNVWKNFRTVLIWIIALVIYYIGGNAAYGEEWHTPESACILAGFMVMGKYWYVISGEIILNLKTNTFRIESQQLE